MFEYRQVLVRLHAGDSGREITRDGWSSGVGQRDAAALHQVTQWCRSNRPRSR